MGAPLRNKSSMSTIFIIGYMAAGKSTFGRALARRLGYDFIDLDFYIEQRFRSTVKNLFATRGEEGFRKLESMMLREAGEFENTVVACGGGTPCQGDNMDYMLGRGTVVCLEASIPRTVERLLRVADKRPLVAGKSPEELKEFVEAHKKEREPWYSRANIVFSGEELENSQEINKTIADFLEKNTIFGV